MNNLKIADEIHDLKLFIFISMAWFKLNTDTTYYDLELFLRNNNFHTHLYAKEIITNDEDVYLKYPNESNTEEEPSLKYECIYSCRPKEYALQEVLSVWTTLEENLNALKKCGSFVIKNKKEIHKISEKHDIGEFHELSNEEQNISHQLSENKLKLCIEPLSDPNETFENIIIDISKKLNVVPVKKYIKVFDNGFVLGLFVKDKLVSHVGLKVLKINNEETYELVNITK